MKAYTNYYFTIEEEDFLKIKYFVALLVNKEEVDSLRIKIIVFLFFYIVFLNARLLIAGHKHHGGH